jgi:hypothetical protein
MIKSYFGINFDAIVVASLLSLIFFFIIYKFKIIDFLVEKIIYPIIIFFINIYNFVNDSLKGAKNTSKVEGQKEGGEKINDKIKVYINKKLSLVSDWFSVGIIWKFILLIYIPFLFINYLLISKTTKQTIFPLNTDNILDSFGAMFGAIFVALVLSFLLVPSMKIKFKKSFPLSCIFFFSVGIIHYFFIKS